MTGGGSQDHVRSVPGDENNDQDPRGARLAADGSVFVSTVLVHWHLRIGRIYPYDEKLSRFCLKTSMTFFLQNLKLQVTEHTRHAETVWWEISVRNLPATID
jgi:hypothetical protein